MSISIIEAKKRLKSNKNIHLVEYVGWTKKSKFYDKVEKKFFWKKPCNIRPGTCHPDRNIQKLPFAEAEERLLNAGRNDIKLYKDGFNGWCEKSKFYDKIEKKDFWSIPRDVVKNNSAHPNRVYKKRTNKLSITFTEAQKRLSNIGRNDIELCEDGYNGWSKKSKFYDKVIKEYWHATPISVYNQNSCHPKRHGKEPITLSKAIERFKQQRNDIILCEDEYEGWSIRGKFLDLNNNKHFFAQPKRVYQERSNHPEIKCEKAVETSKKRYGKFHLLSIETRKKRNESLIKKYGSVTPFTSKEVKEKCANMFMEKYDVAYPFCSKEIREKSQKTCQARYGTKHYIQSKIGINKNKKRITKYYILETNEPVKKWLENLNEPKPGYTSVIQHLQSIDQFEYKKISIHTLKSIIENYKSNKTQLEALAENTFKAKHYNKKPKEIKCLYRPDFKLAKGIFLNVDGLYWHSEAQKDKWYHFNLRKTFEEANIRIFQFYSNELNKKPEIVKSIVGNALNKTPTTLYARKCVIKNIVSHVASSFLKNNHLMGSTNAKHIGLYHKDELVSILSYKQRKNICKIERFCSKINHNIIGGFSKLLKHVEKNCLNENITEIHNWVDLRYGTGNHLKNKNFILIRETLGWKWTDGKETYNRLKCRANMDDRRLTQKEHAQELGWYKIYDAGQRLWVKHLT